MNPLLFLDSSSTESDVFYVERSSEEGSQARNNTPAVLNSTQLLAAMAKEKITISSVASLEPQIVAIDSIRIPMNPHFHMGWAVNIRSCHLASMISTCPQRIQCVSYYGRDRSRRRVQPPITGAIYPISSFNAPNESEYHWRLRDNVHNNR